jgi:phosphatidylglycerophosphatase GEP4
VRSARSVDWAALAAAGFRGAVFDKDNTLTEPYTLDLQPDAAAALRECRAAFGERALVLYSNSAGLAQYDPDGER